MASQSKLEALKSMAYLCVQCGYCREKYSDTVLTTLPAYRVCPVREHSAGFEHYCARGKIKIAQGILEGRFPYSEELVSVLYTDPDCKLCSWICHAEPRLDPPKIWRAMREDIVAAGFGPPEPLKQIDRRVAEKHNVFGARPDRRARWAAGLDLPRTGELLYFAGCHASYPKPEIARSVVALLRTAGLDIAYLGEDEWCCGVVQWHDGSVEIARALAEHNVEAIRRSGARRVVTACAECLKSLKIEYPALVGKLPFDVVHVSEVLAELVAGGKIVPQRAPGERKITYHDPCQLGRYCNIYDPPRKLLTGIPGVELVEMRRHRGNAWCCGHGADMVKSMDPGMAAAIAADRMSEARETGAEAIVTACPRCIEALERVPDALKVYDLSVVMARAMGLEI